MTGWQMNWKGYGRSRSWTNQGTVLVRPKSTEEKGHGKFHAGFRVFRPIFEPRTLRVWVWSITALNVCKKNCDKQRKIILYTTWTLYWKWYGKRVRSWLFEGFFLYLSDRNKQNRDTLQSKLTISQTRFEPITSRLKAESITATLDDLACPIN
jgi:hypothetical protein